MPRKQSTALVPPYIGQYFSTVKRLGSGTFGDVSLVKNDLSGELYAAKTVKVRRLGHTPAEARLLFSLGKHRRIVNLHAVMTDITLEGPKCQTALLFDWADCGDLSGVIRKYKEHHELLPEGFLWSVFRGVAEGLAFLAHGMVAPDFKARAGHLPVVHGDIKPANLLLKSENRNLKDYYPSVCISDFGGAYIDNGDYAGLVHCTPAYTRDDVITSKHDIWSLGCVCHEMAFGRIEARNLPLPKNYSAALNTILFKALREDRDRRWSAENLFKYLNKDSSREQQRKYFRPLASWSHKHRQQDRK